MIAIVNELLLQGDEFMAGMHLKQVKFTYSSCDTLTGKKKRIKKLKETGDSRYIYQNEPDKTCFKHGMAYGNFNDLNRRTVADKVSRDKQFNIAKNSKYDAYQIGLGSTVYRFFWWKNFWWNYF